MKQSLDRRKFLHFLGGISFSEWIAHEFRVERDALPKLFNRETEAEHCITRLNLVTPDLSKLEIFYRDVMGFSVQSEEDSFCVTSGLSKIEFKVNEQYDQPIYHIAWAIPPSKFSKAKQWLSKRTSLLKHRDGRDEFHFAQINRKAIYFSDPGGNVLELIARYNLPDSSSGEFTLDDILFVNHVGLVVDSVQATLNTIRDGLDLKILDRPTRNFGKIGDEHRHLVLVTKNRYWLPEHIHPAKVFPIQVEMSGSYNNEFTFDEYPYQITIKSQV